MKQTLFLLSLVLTIFSVHAQVETTVIDGKTYYIYPFQQEVENNESRYYAFLDFKEVIKRDEKNRGIVSVDVKPLTKIQKARSPYIGMNKKTMKTMLQWIQEDAADMIEVSDNLMKDITPALEALPDGDYVQFYRDIPYVDGKTIRYKNDIVAGYFSIRKNQLNGPAKFFYPGGQLLKEGIYLNGSKTGTWKAFNYKVNFIKSYVSEKEEKSADEDGESAIIHDTITELITFKNGIRHGAYLRTRNAQILEKGEFSEDKSTGTWEYYGKREIKTRNEKGEWVTETKEDDYILLERYTLRTDKQRGKGLLFRTDVIHDNYRYGSDEDKLFFFDTLYEYDPQNFPNFGYFFSIIEQEENIELPEEAYESYEGSEREMEGDYMYEGYGEYGEMMDSAYSPLDNYQYIDGKRYRINQLIDSLGYLYDYEGIAESYHQNGQLRYRFEIQNGTLVEESPIYYDNGQIANEIVHIKDSNRFEQRFFDYYGTNYMTISYDKEGKVLKGRESDENEYIKLEGKKYMINFGTPNFLFNTYDSLKKGIDHRMLIEEKRWKQDSLLAGTTYFDPTSMTVETTENNFVGEPYYKAELLFGEEYKSLTGKLIYTYKNIELTNVISGEYTDYYGYRMNPWAMGADSTSPQVRALSWRYLYNLDGSKELKVNGQLFTGNYKSVLNGSTFKVSASDKAIALTIPSGYADYQIYMKQMPKYLKNKKPTDYLRSYFPDYGGRENIGTGILSFMEYDGEILNYRYSDNYDLDKPFVTDREEEVRSNKKPSKPRNHYANSHEGKYLNGKQEGAWITKDETGKVLRVFNYKQGEMHGDVIIYGIEYPAKKPKKRDEEEMYAYRDELPAYLQDPKPKKTTYYVNRRGYFNNGKLEGAVYTFNWLGDTLAVDNFKEGIQEGFSFKRNKLFYSESNFEAGEQDGITRTWLTRPGKDSVLLFELNFQNGSLQGQSVAYHANGKLAKKGFFLNGLPIDDFEAYDTLGFRYQYVKFQYNQPIEEKIWEENQLSIKYEFDWRDSIYFNTEAITSATSIDRLLYEMGFEDDELRRPYYGRPSLVDKTGITYTLTKYYPNDTIARHGMLEKGKKVGCWDYYSYEGVKLLEVEYFDTVLTLFDSIKFKSKGVLTYLDPKGQELSKHYVIEKIEKYDCSHSDHHEERMLYCFWEKDTNQHRINGYTKNYYDNGALQNEGWVKDGIPVGIWKLYDSNGNLDQVGVYKNGKRDGRWLKGDLGSVKNMSEICLNPNIENLEEILSYQEKLLDISVVYYNMGKEIRREYYGINMNNEEAPEGFYEEEEEFYFDESIEFEEP